MRPSRSLRPALDILASRAAPSTIVVPVVPVVVATVRFGEPPPPPPTETPLGDPIGPAGPA